MGTQYLVDDVDEERVSVEATQERITKIDQDADARVASIFAKVRTSLAEMEEELDDAVAVAKSVRRAARRKDSDSALRAQLERVRESQSPAEPRMSASAKSS